VGLWLVRPGGRRRRAAGALVLLGALAAAGRLARPLWPPPPPAAAAPAARLVVAALADEVRAGRAAVRSPSGAALGPDRFVDLRHLAIAAQDRPLRDAGPRPRRWLFMHAPAEVAVELDLPADVFLQTGLALDPAAWAAPTGDGVRFVATIAQLDGAPPAGRGGRAGAAGAAGAAAPPEAVEAVVVDAVVNPRARGEQRRWVDVVADLRPWAGQRVRLTMRTESRSDPTYDWAGWGEPAVVRLDELTAARLRRSAEAIRDLALRP
jgi:hypothetical protein